MKALRLGIIFSVLLNTESCIVNYIPKISDYSEAVVVNGLITDQPGKNTIKITRSQPMWKRQYPKPLTGCIVSISDDLGKTYNLKEITSAFGVYVTDEASFRGESGRVYTLHIRTTQEPVNLSYESLPMKMIPVPSIDSIYYEKKIAPQSLLPVEGCNIFLDTHDPSNNCKFYRWEYSETWEIHSPLDFENNECWITNNPAEILIKNNSLLSETSIIRKPVLSIPNPVDRLLIKYSIKVNQFSLNENEYFYWENLKKLIDQTGGLYDIIPSDIPNNLFCVEEPNKKVLGFFSVSATSSKRLFIKDNFAGSSRIYTNCTCDTIFTLRPDTLRYPGYMIKVLSNRIPPGYIYVSERSCGDCTVRGTNIKPAFWDSGK